MNDAKYIGMDVHQATISVAVRDSRGNLVMEAIQVAGNFSLGRSGDIAGENGILDGLRLIRLALCRTGDTGFWRFHRLLVGRFTGHVKGQVLEATLPTRDLPNS